MPDYNIIGKYLTAKKDLPVFIVPMSTGDFKQFALLKSGQTYPFVVNRVINAGGKNFAIFKVSINQEAVNLYGGETWIPLDNISDSVTVGNTQSGYIAPIVDMFEKIKNTLLPIAGIVAGVWLLGQYFKGGK